MFKSATWLQFYNRVKTPHKIVVGAIKKVVFAEGRNMLCGIAA
jgi:hypothetical protein